MIDQKYDKMTTYHLQLLFGQAIIGSPEYEKIATILSQREKESRTISKKTLCWSKVAGIVAVLVLIATIVFSLLSIFLRNKP
jgi:hypothetical protein